MRPGAFFFNGYYSMDYDMVIQHQPKRTPSVRQFISATATNRNGIVFRDRGTYSNSQMGLNIVFLSYPMISRTDDVMTLFDVADYVDFVPFWDDTFAYRVMVPEPPEIEHTRPMGRAFTFDLNLSVYPFKYLLGGRDVIRAAKSASLSNPMPVTAKPYITLFGRGAMSISINGLTYSISGVTDKVIIDSEQLTTVGGQMTGLDYPLLAPGVNAIQTTADRMEIIPRYMRRAV